ncbi:MAG TPA: taurine dioxygenase [Deltaproteobacteria bacterium]|nr:taurine dioxygenase [Deltaproteobacteria bacterium]
MTTLAEDFELHKLTPQCGAEVRGLDLSVPLAPETVERLRLAHAEHCVLFFRDQTLTPPQLKQLGQHFGELHLHPAWPRLVAGHPEVMEIYADENTKRIAGEDWHSDVSCDPEPPLGTMLYLLEVPPLGGDTLFANMYAAFEALSTPLQKLLAGLTALHDGEQTYRGRYEGMEEEGKVYPRSEHPVVRTHPVTGRPLLFVNRIFTTRILELSQTESAALLQMLFRHIEQTQFQCRFQWQSGSLAFWDNRCTQHHALWDYYPHRRVGHRVTIRGDAPFFRQN